MIREATAKLMNHQDLTQEETCTVIDEMMDGKTTPVQTAAFLTALQCKKATVTEILACATSMRNHATPLDAGQGLLEIVGTGGDHSNSFNISTTSSFVCAAGGCRVAKHGNRAASSRSGAADVLEALGVHLGAGPEECLRHMNHAGFCFLFAQTYHKAMKHVGPVRKEMGQATVFNLLGPLTNPARADHQVLGVYAADLVEPMAHVLHGLGVQRGLSVYGTDGFDEISASAPTLVCEFKGDTFTTYTITPEQFGLTRGTRAELVGGTPRENAAITRGILSGQIRGTKRNAVLLNAGAGLYVAGRTATLADGVALAAALIDSGKALASLDQYVALSQGA